MKTFPKTIYVRIEQPGTEGYLIADATLPRTDDTERCAEYQLVRVGRVKVQRTFEK
jgi:hypothetical protein